MKMAMNKNKNNVKNQKNSKRNTDNFNNKNNNIGFSDDEENCNKNNCK